MILLKTDQQIDGIRKSCKLLAQLLDSLDGRIVSGMSTWDIDQICHEFIIKHGGKPAFLHYEGFPASACVSVNEEIIHGIPKRKRIIHDGDIVSVDLGINLNGYFSDSARTFLVGDVKPEVKKLVEVTRECLYKGIATLEKPRCRIQDIGSAVYEHAHRNGFGVVREYCGHGVGLHVHEEPEIPNYVSPFSPNPRIREGMVIAIEPMINLGKDGIIDMPDGWTVVTADGKPAAHWEHTVAITANGPEILTQL